MDFRFDIGYISFNENISENVRGHGSWISGISDNSQGRLGILPYNVSKPKVTLIFPNNETIITTSSIDFQYNITDQSDIRNCSLIVDGKIVKTVFSITKNTIQTITQSFENIINNWTISCTNIYNQIGKATIRDLKIDDEIFLQGDKQNKTIKPIPERYDIINITYNIIISVTNNITNEITNNNYIFEIEIGFSIIGINVIIYLIKIFKRKNRQKYLGYP